MDPLAEELNEILVETFHTILKFEEDAIKSTVQLDLSISEIHLLEAIGKKNGRTVSEIAEDLGISLPSVTIAVKKLIKKKYVVKHKSETDKRSVTLYLTTDGKKIDRLHHYFHFKMTKSIVDTLTDEEKRVMLRGIVKLKGFFSKNPHK